MDYVFEWKRNESRHRMSGAVESKPLVRVLRYDEQAAAIQYEDECLKLNEVSEAP